MLKILSIMLKIFSLMRIIKHQAKFYQIQDKYVIPNPSRREMHLHPTQMLVRFRFKLFVYACYLNIILIEVPAIFMRVLKPASSKIPKCNAECGPIRMLVRGCYWKRWYSVKLFDCLFL